jgi:hypothetical protein
MESIAPLSWGPPSAYLYTLKLDAFSLAWEYLRRNPKYRRDFQCAMQESKRDPLPRSWGLLRWEDPREDARDLEPAWLTVPHSTITLVPGNARESGAHFDFWKIPGRRSLHHDGAYISLTARRGGRGSEVLHRVRWPEGLGQGEPLRISVSADREFMVRTRAARDFLCSLDRDVQEICPERPSSRALTHMHVLQALDGQAAGASQREIARGLLGSRADSEWDGDSRWRARVRYLLRCGRARCVNGYRRMVGLGLKEAESEARPRPSRRASEEGRPPRGLASTQRGTLAIRASAAGALA